MNELTSLYDAASALLDERESVAPHPDEVWRRAVAGSASRHRRRAPRGRPVWLSGAVGAAVAVAVALLPSASQQHGLPGTSSAAAAVREVAQAAARAAYAPVPPGRYGYLRQTMDAPNGRMEVEYWYGSKGGLGIARRAGRPPLRSRIPAVGSHGLPPVGLQLGGLTILRAKDLRGLPTEGDELERVLDGHARSFPAPMTPHGDRVPIPLASARWGMVRQILLEVGTTPALRAAALEVAARLSGVEVDRTTRDPLGRQAVRIEHQSPAASAAGRVTMTEAVYLDPATGATLAEQALVEGVVEATIVTVSRGVVRVKGERPERKSR